MQPGRYLQQKMHNLWNSNLERGGDGKMYSGDRVALWRGEQIWVPADLDELKQFYFRQGSELYGVNGTCLIASQSVTARIYLDPEQKILISSCILQSSSRKELLYIYLVKGKPKDNYVTT